MPMSFQRPSSGCSQREWTCWAHPAAPESSRHTEAPVLENTDLIPGREAWWGPGLGNGMEEDTHTALAAVTVTDTAVCTLQKVPGQPRPRSVVSASSAKPGTTHPARCPRAASEAGHRASGHGVRMLGLGWGALPTPVSSANAEERAAWHWPTVAWVRVTGGLMWKVFPNSFLSGMAS